MMKKEYRNKLIATGAILLGVILFTIIDGFFRYAPEEGNTPPATEFVSETETEE